MNKKLTIFLLIHLLGAGLFLSGQTITDFSVIRIGESAEVQYLTGTPTSGPAGAGQSWDYSSFPDDTTDYTWEALNPANTSFADSFPQANLAFRFPSANGSSESWVYYNFNESAGELDYFGAAQILSDSSGTDTMFQTLNANPERIQNFPFAFGDSFSDSFSGWNHVSYGGFNISQSRVGTVSRTADASGTLTTPAGSWANTVRVHGVINITDAYMGATTSMEIHRFTWYAPGEKYLLMHIDSIIQQLGPGINNTIISAYYRKGTPATHINEPDLAPPTVVVWPVPAQDQIEFRLPEDFHADSWILMDMAGKTILSGTLAQQTQGNIHLNDCATGIYLLRFSGPAGIIHRKIQIQ